MTFTPELERPQPTLVAATKLTCGKSLSKRGRNQAAADSSGKPSTEKPKPKPFTARQPETPAQHFAYSVYAYAVWQWRLSLGLSIRYRNPYRTVTGSWYAASRIRVEQGVQWLMELKRMVEEHGKVPAEMAASVEKRFGAEFSDLLRFGEAPVNLSLLSLVHSFDYYAVPGEAAVPDPETTHKIILKLIDLHAQFLKDIHQVRLWGYSEQAIEPDMDDQAGRAVQLAIGRMVDSYLT